MASGKGQRLLSVFKALEAHPLIGISNKEIGNFAYSVKTLQIAERFRRQTEYLKGKLEETGQRVNRI